MRSLRRLMVAAVAAVAAFPALAVAEGLEFEKLRYEESYAYLDEASAPRSPVDPIKRIPLPIPETYISLGGEIRLRYDYAENPAWGDEPQDDWGAFLQRYLVHADVSVGRHVRTFIQLRSALEDGRDGPPSPVEEGELALQQAFLELSSPFFGADEVLLRGGRQELSFGSERLVAAREGPNIRRRFDGLRIGAEGTGWEASALGFFLTENEEGVFNDDVNEDVALWGIYATADRVLGVSGSLDLYYLGYRENGAEFVQGIEDEERHSVGARLFGASGGFDWNWEFIFQWGEFGDDRILAWTIATDSGYRFDDAPLRPRTGISANIASGDDDPDDGSLGTFNPLFPRGNYFSHLALLGPRNFVNLHPSVELEMSESLRLGFDVNLYWRLESGDGIYAPNGDVLREGSETSSRFVGTAYSASVDWDVSELLFLGAIFTHVVPGSFVERTGRSREIDFVELTAQLRF